MDRVYVNGIELDQSIAYQLFNSKDDFPVRKNKCQTGEA
jgi:hypothetical protein